MSFNRIVAIGDSWTAGEGVVHRSVSEEMATDTERNTLGFSKRYGELINSKSWVKYLADSYGVSWENYGSPGCSNETILHNTVRFAPMLDKHNYDTNALVIIMWSSKFRDKLFCLPQTTMDDDNRWMFRSEDLYINDEYHSKFWESEPNNFFKEFKKYFLAEIFDEYLYDYYAMCYRVYLQKWLEHHNIKYIMCNAFEIPKEMDKVNKKYYYNYNSTLFDEINEIGGDIWEEGFSSNSTYTNGLHPNEAGYKIISDKLKKFIDAVHL